MRLPKLARARVRVPIEPSGTGEWTMAMPADPGTHRIYFHGESPKWTSVFATLFSSSAQGAPWLPEAKVWPPELPDDLLPSVELFGAEPGGLATLTIVPADDVSTVLPMIDLTAGLCGPQILESGTVVNATHSFGKGPYSVILTISSGSDELEAAWK